MVEDEGTDLMEFTAEVIKNPYHVTEIEASSLAISRLLKLTVGSELPNKSLFVPRKF